MPVSQRATESLAPKPVSAGSDRRHLRLSHVRSVFRLLSEVRDLGVSPLAWRRHMVGGLLKLVDGDTGFAAEAVISKQVGSPKLLGTIIAGVRDPRLVSVYRAFVERGVCSFQVRKEPPGGWTNSTVTRTRSQMAENRAWRQRPDLDPWRALDCEYFICSNQYLPTCGCVHVIILTRSRRERSFDELDRRIVALFHAEVGRLWRRTGDNSTADLPPQLQRTLELLLEGLSEGQIVARLQRSPHTVHDHVKRLYGRFQVNSRAQLLARLSHTALVRAPRLCVNLLRGEDDRRFDAVDTVEAGPARASPADEVVKPGLRAAQA